PSIWYEFVYETAKKAKEKGLLNVMVTNGYISEEPLKQILPYIDAMNIDLKAFHDKFYRELVKGGLEDVKETIKRAAKHCHVEVTTLVIPGWNDSIEEMEELSLWLSSLSPDIPLHLSRYFPKYEMTDRPPTSLDSLMELKRTADRHLNYVYLGNV
ncbi:MAG TPA: radical SAM protein, partial [Anaerovoracaceae bacterium]|nr:radical SAM protein [Anaerovoracaceae bacterium]